MGAGRAAGTVSGEFVQLGGAEVTRDTQRLLLPKSRKFIGLLLIGPRWVPGSLLNTSGGWVSVILARNLCASLFSFNGSGGGWWLVGSVGFAD